ncbi:MAG TPA: bifunctional metallophosphatase/5'-nucleotidase, partial [Actinobacteria bacterium]|nr:bifunctional metallophosphatase/5'-nucleotidase [Actinomycetota bacterium]
MTRRSWWASAVAIVLAVALAGPTAPALAKQVGSPQAPTDVTATVVDGGVRVAWTPPSDAGSAITHYVVHAGQGSCPVTVGADATSAVMPVVQGQRRITPRVQAVNAAGYSPDAKAAGSVNVKGRANRDFTNLQVLEFSDFHGAVDDTAGTIGAATLVSA